MPQCRRNFPPLCCFEGSHLLTKGKIMSVTNDADTAVELLDCNGDVVNAELNPLMARFLNGGPWTANEWDLIIGNKRKYSYALLTLRAIEKIGKFGPLIEIGAGTGYWASQIELLCNVWVVAFDMCPLVSPSGRRRCRDDEENGWHGGAKGFFDVGRGTEAKLDDYEGSTLVLMFPPKEDEYPLGCEALKRYTGEHFIYVGEPEFLGAGKVTEFTTYGTQYSTEETRGRTGTPAFHQELKDNWELVEQEPLPNWPDLHASLFIYRRKK